ncbi:MAG: DUF2974 domain-containing protein [Lachnospiraceae bacterium]|nr:DUF2974 domain-containing protein [Lachnospiraceae bacterium]
MTQTEMNDIDLQAILNIFTYTDIQYIDWEGWPIWKIISDDDFKNHLDRAIKNKVVTEQYREILNSITKDSDIGQIKLIDQSSWDEEYGNYDMKKLIANTFEDAEGNLIVVYRGTGDGKWVDNGVGLVEDSEAQKYALEYFEYIANKYSDKELYVTGHSKGGNLAQYVTMFSENWERILKCYSIDGQGFSVDAVERFMAQPDYQEQLEKMYSINGENDYVHDLGKVLIDSGQTYFISTPYAHDVVGYHDLPYFFYDEAEDGSPLLRNSIFTSELTGESTFCTQGKLGEYIAVLSKEMMKLDKEELEDCAVSIMYLMEVGLDSPYGYMEGTVGREKANVEEFCGLISVGIPLILKTAVTTEEGRALIGELAMDAVKGMAKSENSISMLVGLTAVALVCAPAVLAVGGTVWMGATVLDSVIGVFDGTFEMSDIFGGAVITKLFVKAAVILATHPQIVIAVIALISVTILLNYIIQHWKEITSFIESVGDFLMGIAAMMYAWAENLADMFGELIRDIVRELVERCQEAKQAIIEFAGRVMSAVSDFIDRFSRSLADFFGGVKGWLDTIFGGGSAALSYGSVIAVTVSRVDAMQESIGELRSCYLNAEQAAQNADKIIDRVYSHYRESYVRNCCRDIENNLKYARQFIDWTEQELKRKKTALRNAAEAYRKADQKGAGQIRNTAVRFS